MGSCMYNREGQAGGGRVRRVSEWPWTDGTRLRQRVKGSIIGRISYLVRVVLMTACWEKAEEERTVRVETVCLCTAHLE